MNLEALEIPGRVAEREILVVLFWDGVVSMLFDKLEEEVEGEGGAEFELFSK